MRTIATLQQPDQGTIHFFNLDVLHQPVELRKQLGYLAQEFGVYPRVNAYDMLDHLALLKGIISAADRKATVEALLHRVNLWEPRKKALTGFSGGMRQRFGIAQAFSAIQGCSSWTSPPPASTLASAIASTTCWPRSART
jgi:ABC-2 type transport system ATP-binding protein